MQFPSFSFRVVGGIGQFFMALHGRATLICRASCRQLAYLLTPPAHSRTFRRHPHARAWPRRSAGNSGSCRQTCRRRSARRPLRP